MKILPSCSVHTVDLFLQTRLLLWIWPIDNYWCQLLSDSPKLYVNNYEFSGLNIILINRLCGLIKYFVQHFLHYIFFIVFNSYCVEDIFHATSSFSSMATVGPNGRWHILQKIRTKWSNVFSVFSSKLGCKTKWIASLLRSSERHLRAHKKATSY